MPTPKFTCPICGQPKYKKEIFTQAISHVQEEEGVKITYTYKRKGCAACLKSQWIARDGTVLLPGRQSGGKN
jgi:hypothetical protein